MAKKKDAPAIAQPEVILTRIPVGIPKGSRDLTPDTLDEIVRAYMLHQCSLVSACYEVGVDYIAVIDERDHNSQFKRALQLAKQVIDDEIHRQYMERVLDPKEHNPAWKIFYMKNNMPQYFERARKVKLSLDIKDSRFTKVVTGTIIKGALSDGQESRSGVDLDAQTDSTKVH